MSKKPKTPQEKKELSLLHDRRNAYGENDKASRKSIPRRKQESHKNARRVVTAALHLGGVAHADDTELLDQLETSAKSAEKEARLKGFVKSKDIRLGVRVLRNAENGTNWMASEFEKIYSQPVLIKQKLHRVARQSEKK